MEAVLFDLFGTLVPGLPRDHFVRVVETISGVVGVPRDALESGIRTQFPLRMTGAIPDGPAQFDRLWRELGAEPTASARREAYELWSAFQTSWLRPKPRAIEVLERLAADGITLALVSDCSSDTPRRLDDTALGRFFRVRAASAHLGVRKPDPRMYHHALDGLGVAPERALFVGDGNSNELAGARRVGLTSVWIDDDPHSDIERVADHRITCLTEIPALLDALRTD